MENLGLTKELEIQLSQKIDEGQFYARVTKVHKERYIVQNNDNTYSAELTGNLRFTANSSEDFPVVGDWVKCLSFDNSAAIILEIFTRHSQLSRKHNSKKSEIQMIASNIDYAVIVMSANQDFNLNRMERFITMAKSGKIAPLILITKIDLVSNEKLKELKQSISERFPNIPTLYLSVFNSKIFNEFSKSLEKSKTYCFLGSSGVGKSTIINRLTNSDKLRTAEISSANNKGKHTTTSRELICLDNGAIVIDTPGMKEIGLTSSEQELKSSFETISELAGECKFSNCTHSNEKGCKITKAINQNLLSQNELNNYMKLIREQEHYSMSVFEKRKKSKDFSKMVKKTISNKHSK